MRAYVLSHVGAEPALVDAPEPAPPAGVEGLAVARVLAAGVNPVDLKMAADPSLPVPRTVGNEAVVEVAGRRGYAERTVAPHGSFAERALVHADRVVPLPDDVADGDALAIGIVGLAAWIPLVDVGRLDAGETVLVMGATGAAGRMAVQLARLLGAGRVVGAGRDRGRLDELTALGADAAVALGGDDDARAVREATEGGADLVVDYLYGEPLLAALGATRPGARLVSAGASAGPSAALPFGLVRGRTLLTHSNQQTDPAPKRAAYERLLGHLRAGDLQVSTRALPLTEAAEAWRLQRGSPGTKLVLVP